MIIKVLMSVAIMLVNINVFADCVVVGGQLNTQFGLTQNQFTIGNELPNGSVLLNQSSRPTIPQTIDCTSAGQFNITREPEANPLTSSGLIGSYGGDVYQTKVPGLGVYYFAVNKPILGTINSTSACTGSTSCLIDVASTYVAVQIVKTGNIAAGSILNGSDLPCVMIKGGQNNSMVNLKRVCFSGQVKIESFTCKTPGNVTVPLGSYDVSTFSGINSTTKWVDASISLTNCPPFYGVRADGIINSDNIISYNALTPNNLSLMLTPVNGVSDAARGIINLDTASSARGVGIQVASGDFSNPALVNFNNITQSNISIPYTNTMTSLTIPLSARYIQTSNALTPGSANGQMIYVINYY